MKKNNIFDIQEYLNELGVEVDERMAVATKEAATTAVKELKAKSAAEFGEGEYSRGWTFKKTADGYVIYNKPAYRLTHLLEKGHDIVGPDKKKHGRTPARPHIKPVEESTEKLLEDLVMKELNNL